MEYCWFLFGLCFCGVWGGWGKFCVCGYFLILVGVCGVKDGFRIEFVVRIVKLFLRVFKIIISNVVNVLLM